MSPVGGVGINLAVQDAVVAANLLAEPLRGGRLTESDLAAVQRRRQLPTLVVQLFQAQVQRLVLGPALRGGDTPRALRLLGRVPLLRDLPARQPVAEESKAVTGLSRPGRSPQRCSRAFIELDPTPRP
jgi:2-polyprenyl-6-methoxyphenol hydroxylase-like FAD-dependent oxidoreductase